MHRRKGLENGMTTTISLEHRSGTERVIVVTRGDTSIGFARWVVEEVSTFFIRHGMKGITEYDVRLVSVEDRATMVFEITALNKDLPKKPVDAADADPFWDEFHDTTVELETVYRKMSFPLQ